MYKTLIKYCLQYVPFLLANLVVHGVYGAYEFIVDTHKEFRKIIKKISKNA